jgi:hypothetical protein
MSKRPIATGHQRKILELVLDSDKIWALRVDLHNPQGSGAATIHTTFGTFDRQGTWYPGGNIDFALYVPNRGRLRTAEGRMPCDVVIPPQSSGRTKDYNGFLYVTHGILDPQKLQEQAGITSSPKYVHAMAHNYDKHQLGNRLVCEVVPQFVAAGYEIIESVVWSIWAGRPPALEMDGQVLVRNPDLSCRGKIADYCRRHEIAHKAELVDCFK